MSDTENTPMQLTDAVCPTNGINPVRDYANDIAQNASFPDLEHFQAVFNEYQAKTNTKYKKDSGKRLNAATDPDIVAKFEYEHVVFKCVHYGQPRKRSKGIRECKQYLALGCQSRLRLYFRPETMDMCITLFHEPHNHKLEEVKTDGNGRKILPELLDTGNDETVDCVPKKRQKLSEPSTPNKPAWPIPSNTPARTPLAPLSIPESSASSKMAQSPPSSSTAAAVLSTLSTPARTPLAPLNNANRVPADNQATSRRGSMHLSIDVLTRISTIFGNPRLYNMNDAQLSYLRTIATMLILEIAKPNEPTHPQMEADENKQ